MAQVQVTLTLQDTWLATAVDAMCWKYGYDLIPDDGNKPTKAQFAKQQLGAFLRDITREYKQQEAAQSAGDTAAADVTTNMTIDVA